MNQNHIERIKKKYPEGTRIRLIEMEDIQAVPPGTTGTVEHVDDGGTIHMHWDNGRSLGLIEEEDRFSIIEQKMEYKISAEASFLMETPLTRNRERMFLNDVSVDGVIHISDIDFDYFKRNMNEDYNFIRENRNILSENKNSIPVILVKGETSRDGVLIQGDEKNHADYYDYIADCSFIMKHLHQDEKQFKKVNAVFSCKETQLDVSSSVVEKIISLSGEDYGYFSSHLLQDYQFLKDNRECMYKDGDGVRHCLLVIGEDQQDGILVDTQGANYARYAAHFSNAKEWISQHYMFSMIEDIYDVHHVKEDEINVLIVEPGKAPYEKKIPNTLEAKQKIVEGHIQAVPLSNTADMICNDEGKLMNLPPNRRLANDVICGTFLIVGTDGSEDFCSLNAEDMERFKNVFSEIEDLSLEDVPEPVFRFIEFK